MTEVLYNPTWFPLFFVEVTFFAPDGLCFDGVERQGYQRLRSVFQLMPHARAVREHSVRALRRDRYRRGIWFRPRQSYSISQVFSFFTSEFYIFFIISHRADFVKFHFSEFFIYSSGEQNIYFLKHSEK